MDVWDEKFRSEFSADPLQRLDLPPVTVQGSIIGVGKVWKTIEVKQMTKIQDGCEDLGPACLCF